MIRQTLSLKIDNLTEFKTQMLNWASQFNICVLFDNHEYDSEHHNIECLLAVGAVTSFEINEKGLEDLRAFIHETNDWLFGHVSYDFKNHLSKTASLHADGIGFPDLFFFQPATVVQIKEDEVVISCLKNNPLLIFEAIKNGQTPNPKPQTVLVPAIQPKISKADYLTIIDKLKQHILRGDCYEINFCQEFFAENAAIDTVNVYEQLSAVSPNPFSCYYKLEDKYLLCASPERYLKKTGNKVISQPIKGTFKRNNTDAKADEQLKKQLSQSKKDQSENVMVVDLVRNDLSKICKEGTVKVDELFGIYSFPQVHQMISTISGQLNNNIDFVDILEATFPMGSMTGAPKKRVMELIEQYEQTKRGIYSGCVGYITPEKDFDFNVVIRSIMYNQATAYLSYQVGGGITFYSDAENEYEECLLKAEAIRKIIQ